MSELPEPLTPSDCDLRDFGFMPIEPGRLFGSEFHALADDAAWRAGVTLWLKAWHQVPAASLPDDETALARLAELGRDQKAWKRLKTDALRGWVKCADGRLYHPVVAEKALEAWLEKLLQRVSSASGNAKRWGGEADVTAINDAVELAAGMLTALSPQSKSLTKLVRRQSRMNATGKPTGNATGTPDVIPPGSQGTDKGQGIPPTPRDIDPAGTDLAKVMRAGGMITQPSDHALLREWLALPNMELERDILPVVERKGREILANSGKAPFKLRFFDPYVREQHAADEAELVRLRRVRENIERQDLRQREERQARDREEDRWRDERSAVQ